MTRGIAEQLARTMAEAEKPNQSASQDRNGGSSVFRTSKSSASLSNPFINHLFNNPNFKGSGPLKEVMTKLCQNPADFAILIPSTMFFALHVNSDTGKRYSELCKDLDFILTHIVRIDVTKEPRIRTHKEFTTLNNKTIVIKADMITSLKNFKHPVTVTILKQELMHGFADYIPMGTCFHVIYISDCLVGNFKFMGISTNMLTTMNIAEPMERNGELVSANSLEPVEVQPFEVLIAEYPGLMELSKNYKKLFLEFTFKKCKTLDDLEKSFIIIIKRGSAMFNALDPDTFKSLLERYTADELRESLYNYLEMNIYDRFWVKFNKLSVDNDDKQMDIAYEKLKWLSITEIGLPDKVVGDPVVLPLYIKRIIAAITEFKRLSFANTSSLKCSIIMKTVEILSANSTIDADTLMLLLIFVICLSKVSHLNNHLKYIRKYTYSETNTEKGILGYALSSLEIAVKYFHSGNQLQELISKSLHNEVLWRLIGAVSSDFSVNSNKQDDEKTFQEIEGLLKPLNKPDLDIPLDSFVKSRSLEGDSCLMFALKQNNKELMNVLLQFEYIFTLDDILEDQNINGSNLLATALTVEHPFTSTLAQIIKQATPDEIEKYVNAQDSNNRTIGHLLYNSYSLLYDFGLYVDWTKRDCFGNTPLMVYARCYDHPNYDDMMTMTLSIVKQWYHKRGRVLSYRDHLDNKGNTLMHTIKDSTTLELFLKSFDELELNYLNDANQSAVSLAVRYNRIDNVEIMIKDPRFCLSVVDPVMYMSPLDYVKLERWEEDINRNIAKMLEIQFIWTEYGENLDIACVRARFEPENGLCCYFRVVNNLGKSDLILVPFSSVVKAFKLMKKETPCIPFNFNSPDIWFPKHLYVSMKGNISSSNKIKINALINNINLMIQALNMNGTLEHTATLQNYLLAPQEPCKIEVQTLVERNAIKAIYSKNFSHRKSILLDQLKFKRMIIKGEDIIAYDAFLEYSVSELERFSKVYYRFYRSFALSNEEAKDLDKLRTDMPWIVDESLRFRECRIEDASDIFLDKIRLLYASVDELVKVAGEMRSSKLRRWRKLVSDLKSIRSELDRIAGSGVDGSSSPVSLAEPAVSAGTVKNNRQNILAKVFKQIDILTGVSDDETIVEEFRKDIIKSMFRGKSYSAVENTDEMDFSTKEGIDKTLEELIDLKDTGIGSWFVEKRRVSYVGRLLETFLKFRIELVELDLDLRKHYESLAMLVSKFYQFRISIFKNAYGNYAKGKIGELKREVKSWELGLWEYKNKARK